MVKDFSRVIPAYVSGLPSIRDLEFFIDITLRIWIISIYPNRMSPLELEELKK